MWFSCSKSPLGAYCSNIYTVIHFVSPEQTFLFARVTPLICGFWGPWIDEYKKTTRHDLLGHLQSSGHDEMKVVLCLCNLGYPIFMKSTLNYFLWILTKIEGRSRSRLGLMKYSAWGKCWNKSMDIIQNFASWQMFFLISLIKIFVLKPSLKKTHRFASSFNQRCVTQ